MNSITVKFNPQVVEMFEELFSNDFLAHNSMVIENEIKRENREKVRNKVIVGFNVRIILADERTNPEGYSFKDMYDDPDVHGEMMLRMEAWTRSKMKFDWEMGLPDKWIITPYSANVYEDSLLGGEVLFPEGYEVPATRPYFLGDEGFDDFMNYPFKSIPDQGFMRMIHDTYSYWKDKCEKGWEYLGRPVVANPSLRGTDGPFTIACNTFGPQEICLMALDDPAKFNLILERNVDLAVKRINEVYEYYDRPWNKDDVTSFGFADDMIAMISK